MWLFYHSQFPALWPNLVTDSPNRSRSPFLNCEQTIRSAVECSGVGLHSGAPVSMRMLPAPSGTGIVFRRTDLDGFEIEAVSRNVARVSYATSLMKKGVFISTTEHVLSAIIGVGIDNAIIELDNLELPILDGSAKPFVDMIQKAGIRRQRRPRKYLRIRRELEMREGNKFIGVYPPTLIPFPTRSIPASADWQRDIPSRTHERQLSAPYRRRPHVWIPAKTNRPCAIWD